MILTEDELIRIFEALRVAPFETGMESWFSTVSVVRVLRHGNKKHGEKLQTSTDHINHAIAHTRLLGVDPVTNEPHRSHALARLLLAIITLCREGK